MIRNCTRLTLAVMRKFNLVGKQIWDQSDLVPKEQRQVPTAATDDLRAIARVQ